MAIEFHCEHCGKLIRAADEHGGKHGTCPACHQRVYIPTSDVELLTLAPIDEAEERARKREEELSKQYAARLLRDREFSSGGPGPEASSPASSLPPPEIDVESLITEYAICMADGNLAEAEELADEIRRNSSRASEVIQRLMADDMPPPALEKIPRPVLVGFFRQLKLH